MKHGYPDSKGDGRYSDDYIDPNVLKSNTPMQQKVNKLEELAKHMDRQYFLMNLKSKKIYQPAL